ncbi:MAG: cell division protein ZapA [Lachnospiraceae bacterium]|nr:cell division protein ZapA [Lachnospiraceae bacterium]
MAQKNDIPVIINGKVYTLSGYESEEYLQSIAMYINNKITECKSSEHYRKLNAEYQGVLLALNIADDYFKIRKQAEESNKVEDEKDKQLYDLRHEVIETRIKQESALKLVEEYKEQVNALQRKIIQLEAEQNRSSSKK